MKYEVITGTIIKSAMEVHKILKNGFQEVIYQRALAEEFQMNNLNFRREYEMDIFYKNIPIGTRRVDFLVEDKISVEIKAVVEIEKVHIAQALNYLEAYNLEIGLLINFGNTSLKFHRLENKKYIPK